LTINSAFYLFLNLFSKYQLIVSIVSSYEDDVIAIRGLDKEENKESREQNRNNWNFVKYEFPKNIQEAVAMQPISLELKEEYEASGEKIEKK